MFNMARTNVMNLICHITIYIVMTRCSEVVNVDILKNAKTWNEGIDDPECHLLGKEFSRDSLSDLHIGMPSGSQMDLDRLTEYWIGAHVQYTGWLRVAGCYYTEIRELTSVVGSVSVRECIQFCDGRSFGLTVERCVCLESPNSGRRKDDECGRRVSLCPGSDDEFCGNDIRGRRSCLCKYEIFEADKDREIGNCKTVMYDGRDSVLNSRNCSEQHSFLCNRKNRDVSRFADETTWANAGLSCYREHNQQFLSDVSDTEWQPSGMYWVGIFRKEIFSWGNNIMKNEAFDCVSVSINLDNSLNMLVKKCDSKLPLLCETRYRNDETTMSSNIDQKPTSVDVNYTENTDLNTDLSTNISVHSLVIGLVCGILVTLLIVGITFAVLRRRKARIECQAIVNGRETPNTLDANYAHLNPDRDIGQYEVLRRNSVTYDYISGVDGTNNTEYIEIIDG